MKRSIFLLSLFGASILYAQEKDSFIVRQHLRLVEKFQDRNAWNNLSQSEKHELITYIAPLVFEAQ